MEKLLVEPWEIEIWEGKDHACSFDQQYLKCIGIDDDNVISWTMVSIERLESFQEEE